MSFCLLWEMPKLKEIEKETTKETLKINVPRTRKGTVSNPFLWDVGSFGYHKHHKRFFINDREVSQERELANAKLSHSKRDPHSVSHLLRLYSSKRVNSFWDGDGFSSERIFGNENGRNYFWTFYVRLCGRCLCDHFSHKNLLVSLHRKKLKPAVL